jgi:hypothetical protein
MSEGIRTEYIRRREASDRLYEVYEFVNRNIIADGEPVPAALVKNIMLRFERALNQVTTAFVEDDIIEVAPAVDAVPVVRCKDCKHRYFISAYDDYYCGHPDGFTDIVPDDGFCSYGERKDK